MRLLEWIIDEHAGVLERFEQSVATTVPRDQWKEPAGTGGSSIAWLMFHTSFHEDLAVNAVLRDEPTVLALARSQLGLSDLPPAVGLGETEQPHLTAAVDLDELHAYVHDVHATTQAWLTKEPADTVEAVITSADARGRAGLERAGIAEADVPWLYAMWDAKPAGFFVQWEAIGHRINHVGEMVSVRNRLGLSPF